MEEASLKSRLKELIEERFDSVSAFTEVCKRKGIAISGSQISDILNKDRNPSYKVVMEIAQYFEVSMDYLCGITEDRTTDGNAISAADYTGLSADSMEILHEYKNDSAVYPFYSRVLDFIIVEMYGDSVFSRTGKIGRVAKANTIISILLEILNPTIDDGLYKLAIPKSDDIFDSGEINDYELMDGVISGREIRRFKAMQYIDKLFEKESKFKEWDTSPSNRTPRKKPIRKPKEKSNPNIPETLNDDLPF